MNIDDQETSIINPGIFGGYLPLSAMSLPARPVPSFTRP
ncbi:hypothetical protein SXCC_03507 [Gluconacetobacter sp. SXCC-1]|nr:hypothetical protein SXCC_03507 [Gluconacetobacter sp. SXCC-1]